MVNRNNNNDQPSDAQRIKEARERIKGIRDVALRSAIKRTEREIAQRTNTLRKTLKPLLEQHQRVRIYRFEELSRWPEPGTDTVLDSILRTVRVPGGPRLQQARQGSTASNPSQTSGSDRAPRAPDDATSEQLLSDMQEDDASLREIPGHELERVGLHGHNFESMEFVV